MGRLLEIFDAAEASLVPSREHPLQVEQRTALVELNRGLHQWHLKYDAPSEDSLMFTKEFDEWYERNDAYRRRFQPEGCSLGDDAPCLIPAQCEVCY
jgi:hypothetical protein